MSLKTVLDNNAKWRDAKLEVDKNYFANLAKGQSPEILYFGCSDSRVTAEQLMGLEPGQVFVQRNVANLVPNNDLSASAVIEYAVTALKIKHIVICGHYYCGGVKAAMGADDLGIINPWLRNIRDVYRLHQAELDGIADEEKRYKRLVELNVHEQCVNVLKAVCVQKAWRKGELDVHGWVFDIGTGEIIDLGISAEKVLAGIENIFRID
jgi:carbonic anhydrase